MALTEEEIRKKMEEPDPLDAALAKYEITPELLAKKLKEELDANKTEFAKHQGKILDEKDVVDWTTRQRAREDAQRLMNLYPAEKLKVDADLTVEIINYAEDEDETESSG